MPTLSQAEILVIQLNRKGLIEGDSQADDFTKLRAAVAASLPANARDKITVLGTTEAILDYANEALLAGMRFYEPKTGGAVAVRFCRPEAFREVLLLSKQEAGQGEPPAPHKHAPEHVAARLRFALQDGRNLPSAYPILADRGWLERTANGYVATDSATLNRRCRELLAEVEPVVVQDVDEQPAAPRRRVAI